MIKKKVDVCIVRSDTFDEKITNVVVKNINDSKN